jgi:hypothetical protein
LRRDDALFDIRCYDRFRTHAIQVPTTAESLHSRNAFVLGTQTHIYVWHGTRCTNDEIDAAERIANMLKVSE